MKSSSQETAEAAFPYWFRGIRSDQKAHRTTSHKKEGVRRGPRPVDDPDPNAWQPVPEVSEGDD